jgi:hypothetical protein
VIQKKPGQFGSELTRVLGEATRKVKPPIGVQLQSSSFFDHLKGV